MDMRLPDDFSVQRFCLWQRDWAQEDYGRNGHGNLSRYGSMMAHAYGLPETGEKSPDTSPCSCNVWNGIVWHGNKEKKNDKDCGREGFESGNRTVRRIRTKAVNVFGRVKGHVLLGGSRPAAYPAHRVIRPTCNLVSVREQTPPVIQDPCPWRRRNRCTDPQPGRLPPPPHCNARELTSCAPAEPYKLRS